MSDHEMDWLHKRPLKPCRKCGLPVTAKWIAGYGEKLRKIAPHPFGGRAGWYVTCECGAWFWPIGNACDGEKQLRVLRKLEREWNRMQEENKHD